MPESSWPCRLVLLLPAPWEEQSCWGCQRPKLALGGGWVGWLGVWGCCPVRGVEENGPSVMLGGFCVWEGV